MYKFLSPALIVLALSGCASSGPPQQQADAAHEPAQDPNGQSGMSSSAQSERDSLDPRALDSQLPIPQQRKLHFGFDQTSIESQYQQMLQQHAAYLRQNPEVRIRLEGHADERGTREYNMGLGERRALMVQKNLLLMGVRTEQLAPVSYGEEKPEVLGESEESFRQNRRVELNYGPMPGRNAAASPAPATGEQYATR